jgi:hypothetical protein
MNCGTGSSKGCQSKYKRLEVRFRIVVEYQDNAHRECDFQKDTHPPNSYQSSEWEGW